LLDVLRKRINHSAFVITFVCSEEPAVNERVDPGAMKFDGKTENVAPGNDAFDLRPVSRITTVFAVTLFIDGSLIATFSVTDFQCYCTTLKRIGHVFAVDT
jgi:hypothetical protein